MLLKSKGLIQEEQRVQADQPAFNRSQHEAVLKLARPITFSVFFFLEEANNASRNKYELIIESAKLADKLGFEAIWTPEHQLSCIRRLISQSLRADGSTRNGHKQAGTAGR